MRVVLDQGQHPFLVFFCKYYLPRHFLWGMVPYYISGGSESLVYTGFSALQISLSIYTYLYNMHTTFP